MSTYYASVESTADALRKLVKRYDSGTLDVVDGDAVIEGITRDEMRERNLFDYTDSICYIHWDSGLRGEGPIKLTVHFHENEISNTFRFTASGGSYSRLSDLSGNLALVEGQLSTDPALPHISDDSLGLPRPDFAEIDSGSISGGFHDGLSDREFKYEVLAHKHDFKER